MATIVNNPGTTAESDSGMGFFLAILLLVIAMLLFFFYGLPLIARSMSGPQVAVPDQIDVNVNTPNSGQMTP